MSQKIIFICSLSDSSEKAKELLEKSKIGYTTFVTYSYEEPVVIEGSMIPWDGLKEISDFVGLIPQH